MAVHRLLGQSWWLTRETFKQWWANDPFKNSVVISYYSIFSLPGLMVIIIALAGAFLGEDAVQHNVSAQVTGVLDEDTAKELEQMVANAHSSGKSVISTLVGLATLAFGATGVFYQLQQVLNSMWQVEPAPRKKMLKFIKDRVFSFGLILTIGFLLLVSLVASAALGLMSDWVAQNLSPNLLIGMRLLNIAVSLLVVSLLFAAIFKVLPDADVRWRDVWVGGIVTAVLFVLAKFGLSIYFAYSDPGSAYGAAGSIILIMLWVTYAALILLFGAQFTKVYASRFGRQIRPSAHAVSTAPEQRGDAKKSKEPPPPAEDYPVA